MKQLGLLPLKNPIVDRYGFLFEHLPHLFFKENDRGVHLFRDRPYSGLLSIRRSAERIFSRLLSIAMQDPTVIGINAIRNYSTITHITVLLLALAAKHSGHPDKIRFVRTFVPNILS